MQLLIVGAGFLIIGMSFLGGRIELVSRRSATRFCASSLLLLIVGTGFGIIVAALALPLKSASDDAPLRGVRHLVLFDIKRGYEVSIVSAFDALSAELISSDAMIAYERGTQNSPEGLGNNLSHAFTLTFEDESQRDQYLTHPLHLQFIQSHVEGNLDSVTVFDYDILHGV